MKMLREIEQQVDRNLETLGRLLDGVEGARRLDRGNVLLLVDSVRRTVAALLDENVELSRAVGDLRRLNCELAWQAANLAVEAVGRFERCGTA